MYFIIGGLGESNKSSLRHGDIYLYFMIKLIDLLNETHNSFVKYGFHYTSRENYNKIKNEGLKINKPMHLTTRDNKWVLRAYGMIPVFLSIVPLPQYEHEIKDWVLLKVDVSGLNVAADLGTLIEFGAYIEETGFWFERRPFWLNGNEFEYDELEGSDKFDLPRAIKQTRAFVVLEDISPDRIRLDDYKGSMSMKKYFRWGV